MRYKPSFAALQSRFDLEADRVLVPDAGLAIHTFAFASDAWSILPGAPAYRCEPHDLAFAAEPEPPGPPLHAPLDVPDAQVLENRRFRYAVFADARAGRARGLIVLFHGLNERDWSKYLPWAARLVAQTGKAVVLFPIAFHMNRAPAAWSDPRRMQLVSRRRQAASPTIANSTFANAAISTRLQAIPQRFCWSGLQTLYDLVQFVDAVRAGRHPLLAPEASVDFFGYSIGAFLGEILLMTDPGGRFAETRLFMFCGGVTLDRMYPNSRYILDSDATIALYAFFLARFEAELRAHERLTHYLSGAHDEGLFFRAMLNYQEKKALREERFRRVAGRVAALALRRDDVIPASEVLNTLQGDFRDLPIRVEVTDFPYAHNHVVPFPLSAPDDEVDRCFDRVFDVAAEHLG